MKNLMSLFFLFICSVSWAQTADQHIYSGNKQYAKGNYKEAASEYQKDYTTKKNREAQYNLGNTLYQQKEYDKATKQFEEAAKK